MHPGHYSDGHTM